MRAVRDRRTVSGCPPGPHHRRPQHPRCSVPRSRCAAPPAYWGCGLPCPCPWFRAPSVTGRSRRLRGDPEPWSARVRVLRLRSRRRPWRGSPPPFPGPGRPRRRHPFHRWPGPSTQVCSSRTDPRRPPRRTRGPARPFPARRTARTRPCPGIFLSCRRPRGRPRSRTEEPAGRRPRLERAPHRSARSSAPPRVRPRRQLGWEHSPRSSAQGRWEGPPPRAPCPWPCDSLPRPRSRPAPVLPGALPQAPVRDRLPSLWTSSGRTRTGPPHPVWPPCPRVPPRRPRPRRTRA